MHAIMQWCDGEFVWRDQGRLRGGERPGPNAGVFGAEVRRSNLNGGNQCKER